MSWFPAVRLFVQFDEADMQKAIEAVRAIDEAAAGDAAVLRHLGIKKESDEVVLGLRHALHELPQHLRDTPWVPYPAGDHIGLMFEQRWHSLADGLALLQSPACPELEVLRRERITREHVAAGEVQAKTQQDREQALARDRAEKWKRRQELGIRDWEALPAAWIRFAYRLAALFNEKDPELAADIRAIARDTDPYDPIGSRGGGVQIGPAMPEVPWRGNGR